MILAKAGRIIQHRIVGLAQVAIERSRGGTGPIDITRTLQEVTVETLVEPFVIEQVRAGFQPEVGQKIDLQALGHGELVGIVPADELVVVHCRVAITQVTADQQLSLLVVSAHGGRCTERTGKIVALRVGDGIAPLGIRKVEAGDRGQPGLDLIFSIQHKSVPLVEGVDRQPLLIVHTKTCIVLGTIITAGHAYVVILCQALRTQGIVAVIEILEDECIHPVDRIDHPLPSVRELLAVRIVQLHRTPNTKGIDIAIDHIARGIQKPVTRSERTCGSQLRKTTRIVDAGSLHGIA